MSINSKLIRIIVYCTKNIVRIFLFKIIMFFTILKVLITALIIVVASEVAKRSSLLAGLIVSMPLITVLTLIWLYWDTKDIKQVSDLTNNTLLMILPSLTFFFIFSYFTKIKSQFSRSHVSCCFLNSNLLLVIYYFFKQIF